MKAIERAAYWTGGLLLLSGVAASIDELEEDLLMVQDALEGWRARWPSQEVLVTPPASWADAPRDPR